ncbi:hypothetical protein B0H17DRAFT_1329340 [Mycena rosella]|uniref:Uncharacterized protein n=1 Tax=Mycena rosella TaxID=1033263 RepID=A0AAD7DNG2_MYCRO|nr:hypothetical protein B0H17DRAFT_1329340 [Mycena rosella]
MPASALADSTNSLKRSPAHLPAGGSSQKKQCSNDRKARCLQEESPTKPQTPVVGDLEKLLRRLGRGKTVDQATVKALKALATGSDQVACMVDMVHSIIESVKVRVSERCRDLKGKKKMLQAELYLEWLCEYEFVLAAVENVLRAKVPIATGRTLFSILFHLIDEYISAVDAHQDGWSHRFPMVPIERYSWVMTLVEEANDSTTDERSTMAVKDAEARLERYDSVMALALQRYKAECTEYWQLSAAIGRKQETLARGCCLLTEQTGYGSETDEMGFGLLVTTRNSMIRWKGQTSSGSEADDSGYET